MTAGVIEKKLKKRPTKTELADKHTRNKGLLDKTLQEDPRH